MEDEERDTHIVAHVTESAAPSADGADGPSVRRFRIGIWRWLSWTLGLSALGAALAVTPIFYAAPPPPSIGGTASLRGASDPGVVAFQIDKQRRHMVVFAAVAPAASGKDYELWILSPGGKSTSLGVFKAGTRNERPLPPGMGEVLSHGAPMKVTLEPTGGTPGGLPTGPTVFHGYFTLMKEPIKTAK
jgi:anti-sigma-K factor RskA